MADETARFAINLEGNAAEHADRSTEALEKLEGALQADMQALRGMQGALRNLQGGAVVNISTMRTLKDQIAAQKAKIAQGTQAFVDLGGKFRGTKPAAQGAGFAIKDLTDAIRATPGPLGNLVGKLGGLRSLVAGGALIAGIVALAAGFAALTIAVVAAGAAILRFGIAAADARRNEMLHLEAVTKLRLGYMGLFAAQGRASMTGARLQGIIDNVSGSVALGREEVGRYTEQLYRMGLRGQTLQDTLEATAIVASTQGDAAAQSFAGWAAGANATGQSVRKLADDVKARLGPIAKAQMLSLGVQSKKLKENLAMIFSGVKIEKFLAPLKEILDIFSQQAAVGRALKSIVTAIFGGLGETISPIALVVKRFFQGMVIGALLVGIGFLKLRKIWRDTFGDVEVLKGLDVMKIAVGAGAAAVFALVAALGGLVIAAAALAAPFIAAGTAIYAFVRATQAAVAAIREMRAEWKGAGVNGAGGIAEGLKSGRLGVIDAAKALGSAALKGFKERLGIKSPSTVMQLEGLQTGAGAAIGIHRSRPRVRAAAIALANEPREAMAKVSRAAPQRRDDADTARPAFQVAPAARGRAPVTQHITVNLTVNAPSGEARDIAAAARQALNDALRQVAAEMGATVNVTEAA